MIPRARRSIRPRPAPSCCSPRAWSPAASRRSPCSPRSSTRSRATARTRPGSATRCARSSAPACAAAPGRRLLRHPGRAPAGVRSRHGRRAKRQRLGRLIGFVERLEQMARPFLALAGPRAVELTALLRAHLELRRGARPAGTGHVQSALGARSRRGGCGILHELLESADPEHRIAPAAYPALLGQLMAARPVRSRAPKHPRLHIWGQLEARLQHADLLLLGGLNEGTWPALVDPGPWLSGGMRQALGLSPVERRIGLAAHDFVQAACARDVVLSRAEKDAQGNPDRALPLAGAPRDPARGRGGPAGRGPRIGAPGRARSTMWRPRARSRARRLSRRSRRGRASCRSATSGCG